MTTNGAKSLIARVVETLIGPAVVGLIMLWGSHLMQGQQITELTSLTKEIKVKVETMCTWSAAHQAIHDERDKNAGWNSRNSLRYRAPDDRMSRGEYRDNSTKTGG